MIPEETPTISLVADNESRPTRAEAEEAVRTLIRWIGDNPNREGLADTPQRFIDAYGEFFSGYTEDPIAVLSRVFEETHGYDDMILLKDIAIESHCEHHIVPILGKAHIAYMPAGRVVGISKLARVIDIFAKRLQTQESMTAQIADTIQAVLKPHGVALLIESTHSCMTTRGVHKDGASMITTHFTGVMAHDKTLQTRFLQALK